MWFVTRSGARRGQVLESNRGGGVGDVASRPRPAAAARGGSKTAAPPLSRARAQAQQSTTQKNFNTFDKAAMADNNDVASFFGFAGAASALVFSCECVCAAF